MRKSIAVGISLLLVLCTYSQSAQTLRNRGVEAKRAGFYGQADSLFVLALAKQPTDSLRINLLYNLSQLKARQGLLGAARDYAWNAIRISEFSGYQEEGAKAFITLALLTDNVDSSFYFLDLAIAANPGIKMHVLANKGFFSRSIGDKKNAISFYQEAYDLARDTGDSLNQSDYIYNLALLKLGEDDSTGVAYLHHAEALSAGKSLTQQRKIAGKLLKHYTAIGDLEKAQEYVNKYEAATQAHYDHRISALDVEYRSAQKDVLLREKSRNIWLLALLMGLSVAISIGVFYLWMLNRRLFKQKVAAYFEGNNQARRLLVKQVRDLLSMSLSSKSAMLRVVPRSHPAIERIDTTAQLARDLIFSQGAEELSGRELDVAITDFVTLGREDLGFDWRARVTMPSPLPKRLEEPVFLLFKQLTLVAQEAKKDGLEVNLHRKKGTLRLVLNTDLRDIDVPDYTQELVQQLKARTRFQKNHTLYLIPVE